jgi:hypothetical protein
LLLQPTHVRNAVPHAATTALKWPIELERQVPRRSTHCLRPTSTRFEPFSNQGVSATGSLSLHRPTSLARPRRLVVPPSRYVVRAAPAHRSNSCGRLPSASPGCCGNQGRASQPARRHGASWRTKPFEEQVVLEPLAELALGADRVERHQQAGLDQMLGRDRVPSPLGVEAAQPMRSLSEQNAAFAWKSFPTRIEKQPMDLRLKLPVLRFAIATLAPCTRMHSHPNGDPCILHHLDSIQLHPWKYYHSQQTNLSDFG